MGETVPYIPNVLNSYNLWAGVALDFSIALQYPLCPLSLSICNSNSSHCCLATKSKLRKIILT